jgi:SAM-dependent methyltransferase
MFQRGAVASLSPTPQDFICDIIDRLSITDKSVVIELGCGDGRWLKAICVQFHSFCIGVEMDGDRIQCARPAEREQCRYDLVHGDMFNLTFTAATHLIFYLSVEGNKRVYEKIKRECRAGTILLAVGFHVSELADPGPNETFSCGALNAYKYIL